MPPVSEMVLISLITNITAFGIALVGAVFGFINNKRTKDIEAKTDSIKYQVKNTHSTNLRHDIDGHGDKLDTIHDRLNTLVFRFQHLEERLDAENKRIWRQLNRRK